MDDVPPGTAREAVQAGRAAGDCLRACVASVLELEAKEVPHFVQYCDHPAGTDDLLWWWAVVGFCAAYGWKVRYAPEPAAVPGGWALADGMSPRGHQHVVVACDGEVVHDPHPSGSGLVAVDGWLAFERMDPADG